MPEVPSELSILHLVHRAMQKIHRSFHEGTHNQLTLTQYFILRAIGEEPGLKQLRITELSHVDRSTVSTIVKGLVQRGLVKRTRIRKDQRAYGVRQAPK